VYELIRKLLAQHGTVLTEHVADSSLTNAGEQDKTDEFICERDKSWIREADIVVAEVTNPSLGVGWEIAYAEGLEKPVICLFWSQSENRLSAMIAGNKYLTVFRYETLEQVEAFFAEQFSSSKGELL
jgi:nucleoside 2-deoxyribosyltransferase